MPGEFFYLVAADVILVFHSLFVAFVVFGVVAIYVGYLLSWEWVRNYRFRLFHLAGVAIVILESWTGLVCPLTNWEMLLREKAGDATYSGSFIQHWLHTLIYYDASEWVFLVCYTLFGILVLASWFIVQPKRHE